jgi:PAS domain S-box-containing protein
MALAPAPPDPERARLAVLYQISRELASRLPLDDLLPRLLQRTLGSVAAPSGSLMVFDAHGRLSHAALSLDGQLRPAQPDRLQALLDHGLAGWVLRQRQAVLIPNTAADPRWYTPYDGYLSGPKSVISAPLMGRERVVGILTVGRVPVSAFGADDLALVDAIAAQAGVAIENAQLFDLEHREHVLSNTLRQVARTLNATLDLRQVLPLMLEQLGRVVGYDSASVLLVQGGQLCVAAARGFADQAAVLRLCFDAEQGLSARVLRERHSLVLDDVRRSPEWAPAEVPEIQAIRAWIGAPLIVQDEVIGLLSVDSRRPGAYTERDGQLVAAFAEQAAVAVLNARLYAQSERRAYGLRALADTAASINGTAELSEILRLVVGHAQQWLGMEGASLALVDGRTLVFQEAVGPVAESVRGVSMPLGAGVAGWVAENNAPIIVPDVRNDPRFFGGVDARTGFITRALACVPVRLGSQPLGVIEVVNPASGTFDPETLEQLDSLASLAGTAIAQARRVAEIQAAEHRFMGLFEDSLDPILISDLDGNVTDANRQAAAFFGWPRAELVGRRIPQLHRTGTAALGAGRYAPLLAGQPISYQARLLTRAGAVVPVEVHGKLIERGGQQFVQWVHHDLSERLALEELRNDLMSMIVHDLRSPLGNILSSLDLMQGALHAGDQPLLASLFSIALRAATRLSRLVDSLLDLRRLEAGEGLLNRAPADLGQVLDEALEAVQPMAAAKGLSLRRAAGPALPVLPLDAELVRRVVVNLLDNAVKYTPPAGAITLSAAIAPQQVIISVRDTGPGVPTEDQDRIFDKFARVHRQAAPKGLGLGLAFCKLAVEAHGGRIWVDSGPDGGATFQFTLPRAAVPVALSPAASPSAVGD